MKNRFLPVSKEDMKERKIEQLDFVYVTGDAYVDHPSFGHAIISRTSGSSMAIRSGLLRSRTGKIKRVSTVLGEPRLGISGDLAGNMDSMVNHYSVSKKAPQNGCLYAGRSDGKTSGLCDGGLLQSDPADL